MKLAWGFGLNLSANLTYDLVKSNAPAAVLAAKELSHAILRFLTALQNNGGFFDDPDPRPPPRYELYEDIMYLEDGEVPPSEYVAHTRGFSVDSVVSEHFGSNARFNEAERRLAFAYVLLKETDTEDWLSEHSEFRQVVLVFLQPFLPPVAK